MTKKILALILASVMALGLVACSSSEEAVEEADIANEEVEEAEEEELEPLTEEDLNGILEGVEDHYVLQNAVDVDYMHGVEYDKTVEMIEDENSENDEKEEAETTKVAKKIIKDVKADTSKIDTATPGTYTVTYTVTVNRKAYDAYKAEEAEKTAEEKTSDEAATEDKKADEKAEDETSKSTEVKVDDDTDNTEDNDENTNSDDTKTEEGSETEDAEFEEEDEVDEADLENVVIEKDIEIVDKDKAEELVESGEEVWTDESKDYGEVLEEEKKSTNDNTSKNENTNNDSANATDTTDKSADTSGSSSKSSDSSSKSSDSSSNSGSSGSSSSGNSSSKSTSCDHNWIATYHDATGHYENVKVQDAYDEQVSNGKAYVCNVCGYSTTSQSEIGSHVVPGHVHEDGASYSYKSTYTTVHHDAVYEQKWVQDTAAYTTYKCSKCGATK